jgi:hypothetical protein
MAFCCSVDRRLGAGGIPIRLERVGVGRSRFEVKCDVRGSQDSEDDETFRLPQLWPARVSRAAAEAAWGAADYSIRLELAAIITLMMIIGGRIVPSFTRNWLARQNPGRLPVPFDRFDVVSLVLSGAGLALWIALPSARPTAAALLAGGVLQSVRLARSAGHRTQRDRLVLVLHLAYAFVPIGFHTHRHCGARFATRERQHPCLDSRRDRHHDARRDDPRQPWPHRAPSRRSMATQAMYVTVLWRRYYNARRRGNRTTARRERGMSRR